MKPIVLICFVCGLAAALRAQDPSPTASPTPPTEPFLERAPAFSQWTITRKTDTSEKADKPSDAEASPSPAEPNATPTPSGKGWRPGRQPKAEPTPAASPAPEMPQTTTVTKTMEIRYEHTTDKTGEKVKRWSFPGIQVALQGEGPAVVSLPSSSGSSSYIDYSETDFDGFQWLSKANFVGVTVVDDQECYKFHGKVKGLGGPSDVPSERVACINTATRLPVTLQVDDELLTYQFGLAPTAMLKPPAEVMTQVEQWRKSVQQSSLMPAKP